MSSIGQSVVLCSLGNDQDNFNFLFFLTYIFLNDMEERLLVFSQKVTTVIKNNLIKYILIVFVLKEK